MGVPKPTEMTIRNFLLKELESRGIKVDTEVTYSTPIGRLMPDMLLHNGAQYVVETKLGAEAKLFDAMVQLYDYSKYTQAIGAFAVLFPKELRHPWNIEILEKIARDPKLQYVAAGIFKDLRPSQHFSGDLLQLADWIAKQVVRPLDFEVDTSFAIKVLTEAVESLNYSVKKLKGEEIEDIFGGKTVFENILQYKEGRYPLDEMRQATTYLLINQIIFYHVLSTQDKSFEPIDEDRIKKPNDLLKYFKPVLDKNYSSIYGFDVASRLPESSNETLKRVIITVKALAPEKIGHDVLGKVFHELIPFNIRKAVAAFYTNNEAAEILAQLSIEKPDAKVIDLAVGSGALLVAAYRRKKQLLQTGNDVISLEDHKRFLEQDLTGIDIMPFAAHLAVMHLSLQALLHETEKVRVAVWDSTELKPDMDIPAISSELKAAYRRPTLDMFKEGAMEIPKDAHIKKGVITLDGIGGEKIPLEKVDLVIMNPPFTRQERLPKDYKDLLSKKFQDYSEFSSGQLGLHGYFIFLADKFVKKDGRIALVLPATVLRLGSTLGIRKLLLSKYQVEHIITTLHKAAFSEGAQFREILLIAKKVKNHVRKKLASRTATCIISSLKRLPSNLEEARQLASDINSIGTKTRPGDGYEDKNLKLIVATQEDLRKKIHNMFVFIASQDLRLPRLWDKVVNKAGSKLKKVGDFMGDNNGQIIRGIEMTTEAELSAYDIFVALNETRAIKIKDVWVANSITKKTIVAENRFTQEVIKIPLKSTLHGLRRASGVSRMDISEQLDYFVVDRFKMANHFFLGKGEPKGALSKWKRYIKSRSTGLVFSRRFNLSAPGTVLLAYFSSQPFTSTKLLWCFKGLSEEDSKLLTLWFNSTLNLLQVFLERMETEGAFISFGKYVLENCLVLDARALPTKGRNALLHVFNEIKDEQLPSLLKQLKSKNPVRVKMDRAILKVLGYNEERTTEILTYLYPALASEIQTLKTLMAG